MTPSQLEPAANLDQFHGALEYKAPFVIERLIKEQIAADSAEGAALFDEVKRYLVLTRIDRDISWQMYSARVDGAWHQFVLFTHEYAEYCNQHLGGFVHHRPSNAPEPPVKRELRPSSFQGFRARYREVFGQRLPNCWIDAANITINRRLVNDKAGHFLVSEHQGKVSLNRDDGTPCLSTDAIALEALTFIARTASFHVRELPGDLTDEERIGLSAALVEHRVLRVGA